MFIYVAEPPKSNGHAHLHEEVQDSIEYVSKYKVIIINFRRNSFYFEVEQFRQLKPLMNNNVLYIGTHGILNI